ncbi:Rid family hydrolase [Streptomyces sp. BH097]|uniref:Rid family hydrolase n=1 Tax=unclassified Streptomyces TaxID=2593676 RepID=UPI003BB7D758
MTHLTHMPAVRRARDEFLDPARLPAASAVQVAALMSPDFLMEIEALAVTPE